jgi:hypothetical protein
MILRSGAPGAVMKCDAIHAKLFTQRRKEGNDMGANFQTMTQPGTTSRDEVTKTFSKVQYQDRSRTIARSEPNVRS